MNGGGGGGASAKFVDRLAHSSRLALDHVRREVYSKADGYTDPEALWRGREEQLMRLGAT